MSSDRDSGGSEAGTIMAPEMQSQNEAAMDSAAPVQPDPLMRLRNKLREINVTHYETIMRKPLNYSDLCTCGGRLLLTSKVVGEALFLLLTNEEEASIYDIKGMKLRAFDWLGREYRMALKFLESNGAYRLIGQWNHFLRNNAGVMQAGDDIEIQGFRIPKGGEHSEIGIALLHHRKVGASPPPPPWEKLKIDMRGLSDAEKRKIRRMSPDEKEILGFLAGLARDDSKNYS